MDSKEEKLIQFLSGFASLSKEEVRKIAQYIPVGSFPAGRILQKEGEIPTHCYYVLDGIVREYKWIDGEEKTIEFYTSRHGTISSAHYVQKTPFDAYLECVDDCILINGSMEVDEENFRKFPILKEITAKMVEHFLHETKEKFTNYVLSTPKERYLDLMEKRPELIQRVPLHQIASYLGMTPESLSRIRKRISQEQKA